MQNDILKRARRFLGDEECVRWDSDSLNDFYSLALEQVYIKAPFLISNTREIVVKKGEKEFVSEDTIFKVQGIVDCNNNIVKIKEDNRDRFFNFQQCKGSPLTYYLMERNKKIVFSFPLEQDTKFLVHYFNPDELDIPIELSSIIFNLVVHYALSSELDPNNEAMAMRYYTVASNDLALLLGVPYDKSTKR